MNHTEWQTIDQLPTSAWSALEHAWLPYSGSLTEALHSTTRHQAKLVILRESQEVPLEEDRAALKLPPGAKAYVREGGWYYHGTLWIATRVVIPLSLLNKPGSPLKNLGQMPIGKVLFTHPSTIHHPFEFKGITQKDADYIKFFRPPASFQGQNFTLWARRSLFSFEGGLLLVNEIFLPTFFAEAPAQSPR